MQEGYRSTTQIRMVSIFLTVGCDEFYAIRYPVQLQNVPIVCGHVVRFGWVSIVANKLRLEKNREPKWVIKWEVIIIGKKKKNFLFV